MMKLDRRVLFSIAAGLAAACGSAGEDAPAGGDLVSRGKVVYRNNCMACHAPDPNREGGLGPAVAGASLELLTARILHAEYPPDYTPKRDSRVMVALPFLEAELPALHAFLEAAADGS